MIAPLLPSRGVAQHVIVVLPDRAAPVSREEWELEANFAGGAIWLTSPSTGSSSLQDHVVMRTCGVSYASVG